MALPQYTYDPTSQQYALVGQPATSESGGFGGFFAGIGDLLQHIFNKNQTSAPKFNYDPASQQYTRLASGGQVMNPSFAAQHAQNQGRGQDTMLVHMTPNEVKGLQALAMSHGGSLTINPKTGLPEAGFLSSILPAVVGAGLSMIPGVGPLMAAGIVGGLTGLASGSLGKGLMAGLGAFGGASLGGSLIGAGSAVESGSMANLASAEAAQAQQAALSSGLGEEAANKAFAETYTSKINDLLATAPDKSNFELMQQGLTSSFGSGPESAAARNALLGQAANAKTGAEATGLGGWPGVFKASGAALAPAVVASMMPKQAAYPTPHKQYVRPYTLERQNISGQITPYSIGDTSEKMMLPYNYTPLPIYQAAQGGVVDPDYNMEVGGLAGFSDGYAGGGDVSGLEALMKKRKSLKGDGYYKFAQDRRDSSMEASMDQNFASGGALPPRFLSGGGDGMSDSIKANIDGKQEARLADGEFVVPADVVSHLGNGSSKAGAKKLYAMMDKIRKARTGKERQAPQVNASKYMPA